MTATLRPVESSPKPDEQFTMRSPDFTEHRVRTFSMPIGDFLIYSALAMHWQSQHAPEDVRDEMFRIYEQIAELSHKCKPMCTPSRSK